jgi:hypothetical protein
LDTVVTGSKHDLWADEGRVQVGARMPRVEEGSGVTRDVVRF